MDGIKLIMPMDSVLNNQPITNINIKKDMKRAILFCIIILNVSVSFGQGYGFYQEDGKWGVTYNGEPCVLPRFDNVSSINDGGLFCYEESGRWGFANVWKIISEPFCDSIAYFPEQYINVTYTEGREWFSIAFQDPVFYKFLDGGKWGICAADGRVFAPAQYDEIYDKIFEEYYELCISDKDQKKSRVLSDGHFFLVKEEGVCKLVDFRGMIVVPDVGPFDQFLSKKKGRKYKKYIKNHVKNFPKSVSAEQFDRFEEQNDYASEVIIENTLFRNFITDYSDATATIEDMQKPREFHFGYESLGYKEGKFGITQGDSLIVSGLPSIVTDYGFISTPLVYDSPYFRLQRNPYDVFAYLTLMDQRKVRGRFWSDVESGYATEEDVMDGTASYNIALFQSNLKYYAELLEMAEETGDKIAYDVVSERIRRARDALNAYEMAVGETQHTMERNARLDMISNSLSSVLNSMAAVVESSPSSSSGSGASGQGEGVSSGSSSRSSKKGDSSSMMSGSDQRNYNTLRNTYNKWASDLMQMKNLNGRYQNGYEEKDKRHAQSEMKRIREMAKSKWGKEIPYNSIEDWN